MAQVLWIVVILSVLGVGVSSVIGMLERRVLRWRV